MRGIIFGFLFMGSAVIAVLSVFLLVRAVL